MAQIVQLENRGDVGALARTAGWYGVTGVREQLESTARQEPKVLPAELPT